MCWGKQAKIQIPTFSARQLTANSATSTAQAPNSAVIGGDKSWDIASKKKGVSALTIKKDESLSDTLKKTKNSGVNYTF